MSGPDLQAPTADPASPAHYLNRELTWLSFNWRVLHEAEDTRNPLLERVKFLAIVGNNLDEFFMKRIGGLKQQVGANMQDLTVDGRTPQEQIDECYQVIRAMEKRQYDLWNELHAQLKARDVAILEYGQLTDAERAFVREHYVKNIFPLVTPQAMDPAHPFPFVSNLSLNLLVTLRYPEDPSVMMARLKVPVGRGIPRLVKVRDHQFVLLEDVIAKNLDLPFPDMEILTIEPFRVTRNAVTEKSEEQADDLLAMIESELRERKFAPIVRMQVATGMAPLHRGKLAAELGLDEAADVFETSGLMGFRDLMELATRDVPSLRDSHHRPLDHPLLLSERNIFHVIRDEGPILLHHPYYSFSTSVERLLREAAEDPKVRAIKMTIYRTSGDSEMMESLMEAARNDKQVAVVVELKARFDEGANVQWAGRLEEAGIHVTYGVVGLKTHCKTILIVRQDFDGLRRYAHIGTGNYHAGTARVYADLGLLTCDESIGRDLTELFNYLTTGVRPKRVYHKLLPSPKILKAALLDKIEREAKVHRADSPGHIQMKMNALEDSDVTRALYKASQAGVRIDLIVRDTCRLRPGVPGLSENIRVVSVVGRFLEHGRIFYFRNGGGGQEEYYIGSADLMQRNLESRVEAVVPVEGPELQAELRSILDAQLGDQRSAWDMKPDGTYVQRVPDPPDAKGCQELMIERAEAAYKEATRLRRRKTRGFSRRDLR